MLSDADVLPGAIAEQQGMPDQFFEFSHLLAHRRLSAVHAFGCAGKAAFIHHADEGFEQFKVEHGALL
ncbi:hypothetical protein D3C85_1518430 [compost metagenome]